MPTTLLLVRHGATAANVARPYMLQGAQPDSELIDVGVLQAHAAGHAIAAFPVAKVYCSPLVRARTTAEIIAARLAVPLEVDARLIEADIGDWTGLTWEEIDRRWPSEHAAFQENAAQHGYPGGENLAQVRERVLPVIERLVAVHPGETIAVVGHGVVNRVLLAHWLGIPLRQARQLPQNNAGFSIIEFLDGVARVRKVNVAEHLETAAAAA
ncbi:MAG TPA: histidine phosphatase family protein [Gemmata sp.]|jgi:broad specificity phosphatase PhoE|nr:histidine phosphatase family protein [Gemmata sp.]